MQQSSPQAYLIIQFGNRWTNVLRLQNQPVFVGRSSENQIVVRDERVSRRHASITPSAEGWSVADLGSRNGTQIDEVSIAAPHNLQEGETIGVGGCRITFSRSLQGAFSASRTAARVSGERGAEFDARMTQDLEGHAAIVHRRADSQWSSAGLAYPSPIAQREHSGLADRWNFFYKLVFDLVQCETREQLAQVALERLLEQLGLAAGGVVTIESACGDIDQDIKLGETIDAAATVDALPPLAVLATRQPDGESYQRVSDFLVRTIVRDRQAVLARNIMDDSQLALANQSSRRKVVSIICAPLRVRSASAADDQPIIGMLHVYSAGEERMLSDSDLELAVGVADNLAIALERHAANERLSQSLAQSRRQIDQLHEQLNSSTELVGCSPALERVRTEIRRAAPTQATVLIRGESGVGKELVARAIHRQSQRRDGPLVCLNCAALAPTLLESELFGHEKGAFTGATERKIGKFEAAHDGTLLLDEIGEMPAELQAKFLRILEGQPFERLGGNKPIQTNVRVIAATNRDLEEAVKAKEFRADLYFRLRVVEIDVPPLRSRLDDVPPLVEFFLEQLRQHAGRRLSGIEPDALELLAHHSWPGNVRELRNVLERAIVLGNHSTIGVADLKLSVLGETSAGTAQGSTSPLADSPFEPISLSELEQRHILAMLEHCGGNKTKAAQNLGIERSTLDRKLKRY